MMANRFVKWLVRCGSIGLSIGTLFGLIFVLLSTSVRALMLIPMDTGFALLLGCLSWPLASRIMAHPKSRLIRIVEGTLYGAVIGATILMPFAEGWAMAAVQAIQGAFVGALLGTLIAGVFRWKTPSATTAGPAARA
jgi:prepilin signal peptidase PulO-like enzyme (type II secretory pathway)